MLPPEIDCALITSQVNVFYLTGFDCDSGSLYINCKGDGRNPQKENPVFVTDFRYTEDAKESMSGSNIDVVESTGAAEIFAELARRQDVKVFACERKKMTVAEYAWLCGLISCAKPDATNRLDDVLTALRSCKSESELECIKAAQRITELGFRHIISQIREGVTELDLALELEYFMRKNGADDVSFPPIVASGENGSKPHAKPGKRKIKRGDLITIDTGCVMGGYCSDMTRTVALGEVSDRQREVYNTVLRAQQAALDYLIKGGDDAKTADSAARDVINAAGDGFEFRKCFGHSLGHGVGIEIHESPNLAQKSEKILSPGSVFTIEPGIYIPGEMGVRIEDMALKTEDSIVNLTQVSKELVIVNNE